ncbi:hypothetical protein EW146_g9115 [Bondarzewia mesenterica]|uniref:Uncharacterized protein n=1 Tax=Bondarzewia mesenterica TaxID=1095465 RepID=A0A4S4L936_9AGAM|nr:hypothetical protein EW146_g9115 [Bondarzewia mesenterica]
MTSLLWSPAYNPKPFAAINTRIQILVIELPIISVTLPLPFSAKNSPSAGDSTVSNNNNDSNSDYATGNYPPADDTTSSGGWGSKRNPWDASHHSGAQTPASRSDQSGLNSGTRTPSHGLIDQSTNGGSLLDVENASQGRDEETRETMNPYMGDSWEGRDEAGEALASRYRGSRDRVYESGASAGNDEDVGA